MGTINFTGERIVPGAPNCEPTFAEKMYQEHLARYAFASQVVRGKRVLDLGCGVGYGARYLAERGAKEVVAIDLSSDAIDHARTHYSHPAVTYQVDSAEEVEFDRRFDVVVCFELIEHVNDQEAVFRRISACLEPLGRLVMSTPRALAQKRTDFHTREYSLVEFRRAIKKHFNSAHFYFENNHFTSLVADRIPGSITQFTPLRDQFHIDKADYFIVVASRKAGQNVADLESVLVVNDDAYVTLLERDVGILHRAEDDLKAKLAAAQAEHAALEIERARLEQSLAVLGSDLSERDKHIATLIDGAKARIQVIESSKKVAQQESGRLLAEVAECKSQIQALESARSLAQQESTRLRIELEEGRLSRLELDAAKGALRQQEVLLETLRETLRLQAERMKELDGSVAKLQSQLEATQGELASRQRALSSLQEKSAADLRRLDELAFSNLLYRHQSRNLARAHSAAIESLGGRLTRERASRSEAESKARELDALQAEAELLRAAATSLREEAARLAQGSHVAHQTAEATLRELVAIKSSKRWRYTAPFIKALDWSARLLRSSAPVASGSEVPPAVVPQPPAPLPDGTALLGQTAEESTSASAEIPRQDADVEMFIGCWEGESKRYRVHNVAEALTRKGKSVRVHPFAELHLMVEQGRRPNTIVVFRAPHDEQFRVGEALEYANKQGIQVVFDVDDLVFEPDLIPLVDAFHSLAPPEQEIYTDGVHKYRKMLLASDLVTTSTTYLAESVRKLGKACSVIHNGLNDAQLLAAHSILQQRNPRARQGVTIGYFSGSKTHQKDFACAESALLRIMSARPEVTFLLVGHLDLGPAWLPYTSRVLRHDFVDPLKMLDLLGRCDINIAPLEIGNPFCEGKSELKYFEAALVEVPTIASATATYREAITEGRTGYLASRDEDWFAALTSLVDNPDLRACVGAAARKAVLMTYSPEQIAEEALRSYGFPAELPVVARERKVEPVSMTLDSIKSTGLRIEWIVPGIIIGSGGHRNIFRAAHHLQSFGHDVGLHIVGTEETDEALREIIQKNFYPFQGRVRRYDANFNQSDVVFATHWSTVDPARQAGNWSREVMYFVQDFEPFFAPMGTEFVLAENTYRFGLYHITSGPWCERILRQQFKADADHFQFPIDKDLYYPRGRKDSASRIVFFAKPEMPRRCFELGVMALRRVVQERPATEVVMFGSPNAQNQHIDFPVRFLNIVPTLDDLAQLYSDSDLGMAFSTTNPSLVPYEMMACGLPVVDLDRPGNEVNYGDRRDIAWLANPQPDIMAREVVALLDSPAERELRSKKGLEFAASFPTEEGMARRIESLIIERLLLKQDAAA